MKSGHVCEAGNRIEWRKHCQVCGAEADEACRRAPPPKRLPDEPTDVEWLRQRAAGHAPNADINVYAPPKTWLAIADYIAYLVRRVTDAESRADRLVDEVANFKAAGNGPEPVDDRPGTPLARIKGICQYAQDQGLCTGIEAKPGELFLIEAYEKMRDSYNSGKVPDSPYVWSAPSIETTAIEKVAAEMFDHWCPAIRYTDEDKERYESLAKVAIEAMRGSAAPRVAAIDDLSVNGVDDAAVGAVLRALRADGWQVAVHNDYRQNGEFFTFWLLTHPSGRFVKGEGPTDADALAECVRESRL